MTLDTLLEDKKVVASTASCSTGAGQEIEKHDPAFAPFLTCLYLVFIILSYCVVLRACIL